MRLVLHREIPKLTGAHNTCGILRCEENVTPASTGSSPGGGFDVQDSSSCIFNMTIFKNQPSNSMAFGDEQKHRIAVASLTSEHPNITNVTESLKIIGILKNKSATVWLEMFRHDDCSSDFICEVHGLDSKGRVFLSTSTLVQQKRETYLGDGDVDLTTSLQLLAQQLDTKLAIVSNSLSEVENKMEDTILSFERRVEGKIESAVTDIRDRVHSLENRLEDKIGHQVDTLYQIDAKVSAMNENDACNGNGDVPEKLLTGVKSELSDALENAVDIILNNIDARFFSSQMYLTQNLTDSITEAMSISTATGPPKKKGFGTLDDEFWFGNERIHALTSSGTWELRVDLKYKGKKAFAQYSNFAVESESNKYRLRIGSYSGNAGDSLSYHNGQKFSTFDKDNDESSRGHCARSEEGGWWYGSCDDVDLNSKWNGGKNKGLEWNKLTGSDSSSFSEMKIRVS
ncbi:angiopoietin-related protein 1 [Plakobranchus ocellatus]|uniref:Angiopoietin-related protein 1 n=1 Tax=Plakobranchus ocellatus TaxID=259542 RepID=A0AAV4BLR1_9GAST|nr:angiopoietin-related protein 1 [Plakobranchus ocellatus]